MKIGIITFHWATNYGAVLQAYALQTYLAQYGHDVKVIDYIPYTFEKKLVNCFITKQPWRIPSNLLEYLKELKLNAFRTKHLNLSRRYHSAEDLQRNPPTYDVYICGSDQIWNPSFTAVGEGKITLNYFLDFGPANVTRVAYAASFGCNQYPEDLLRCVAPVVSKFNAVSVRENSGCQIAYKMGVANVSLMPDPTLLLQANDYEGLLLSPRKIKNNYSFFYALHAGQETIKEIKNYFSNHLRRHIIDAGSQRIGIEDWLTFIKNSDFVVTNSYHGVVFSIIFRKPFIAVPVEGVMSGMNDRIYTLLEKIGLQVRMLGCQDENRINDILTQTIEWEEVDKRIASLRKEAFLFFEKGLNNSSG